MVGAECCGTPRDTAPRSKIRMPLMGFQSAAFLCPGCKKLSQVALLDLLVQKGAGVPCMFSSVISIFSLSKSLHFFHVDQWPHRSDIILPSCVLPSVTFYQVEKEEKNLKIHEYTLQSTLWVASLSICVWIEKSSLDRKILLAF